MTGRHIAIVQLGSEWGPYTKKKCLKYVWKFLIPQQSLNFNYMTTLIRGWRKACRYSLIIVVVLVWSEFWGWQKSLQWIFTLLLSRVE